MTTVFTISDQPRAQSCPTLRDMFAARVTTADGKPVLQINGRDFDGAGRLPAAAYQTADDVLRKDGYVIVEMPAGGLSAQANNFMSRRLLATAIGGQVDLTDKQRVFITATAQKSAL